MPSFTALFSDCDGVLTDGKCIYSTFGESRTFSMYDANGFYLLQSMGIQTYIISSDRTSLCRRRAKHIGVTYIDARRANKYNLIQKLGFRKNYLYVGDDKNDLDAMKHSYHSFAPSSAPLYTKNIADTVTSAVGGSGVIFEVANFVLNNLYKHDLKCD